MRTYNTIITLIIIISSFFAPVHAQTDTLDISSMTKEDVMDLSYDQLLDLPLEDLLELAEIVGVSLDELYEMLLNKDVVSASKKLESSFVAPLSTSVIDYDEIKASGARNIEEALRLVPGMIVREKTSGNFDVHIRGNDNVPPNHMFLYSENSISLVMIDGRPVYNYAHGGTFWETLPIGLEDIDRIEVVRGPSSALYGPNAASGVVNIITKEVKQQNLKVNANAEIGTQNNQNASLRVQKKITDKLGMAVTGNFLHADRNTDKLYVYALDDYVTKDMLDTITITDPSDGNRYNIFDPNDDVDEMWPDPRLARNSMGANTYLQYAIDENSFAHLSAGLQHSNIISSTMGDNPTPTVGRESKTGYGDLRLKLGDLKVQMNYLDGWQDIIKQDTGFKMDIQTMNANAEYDLHFGDLNIRPGLSYQRAVYNDMPFLHREGQGFFNGKKELSSLAGSLRMEYIIAERLRLITALRAEDYNTHDDPYFSYQFVAAYNLNDKHLLRAVYSRANQGPFLADSYANFLWERDDRPNPGYILFQGNENLDLLKMDMIELGYRIKPAKNIQADVEVFYTQTKDFGALYPDSVNLNGALEGTDRPWVRMRYQNIETTSEQIGITANISWVINENAFMKIFGTVQQTVLDDMISISQDSTVSRMLFDAGANYQLSGGEIQYSKKFPDEYEQDVIHESTPLYYGGFVFDIKMLHQKLNLNTNLYTYGNQSFKNKYGMYEIDPKTIVNLKLSYKLWKENQLFVNARNILQSQTEFAFLDEIGSIYTVGLSLKL